MADLRYLDPLYDLIVIHLHLVFSGRHSVKANGLHTTGLGGLWRWRLKRCKGTTIRVIFGPTRPRDPTTRHALAQEPRKKKCNVLPSWPASVSRQ